MDTLAAQGWRSQLVKKSEFLNKYRHPKHNPSGIVFVPAADDDRLCRVPGINRESAAQSLAFQTVFGRELTMVTETGARPDEADSAVNNALCSRPRGA
jgi:hypothetical protein